MSAVPKSNLELEAALAGVTDASQLREVMLRTLAAQGQVVRMRGDEFDTRLVRPQQTTEASLPASQYRFEREIRFHPESGKRSLVIRGNSQQDLDALQRQLTGEV
jgi:hypothetical protein